MQRPHELIVLAGFMRILSTRVRGALRWPDAEYSSVLAAAVSRPAHAPARARRARLASWRERALRDGGARCRAGGAAVESSGADRATPSKRSPQRVQCERAHHLSEGHRLAAQGRLVWRDGRAWFDGEPSMRRWWRNSVHAPAEALRRRVRGVADSRGAAARDAGRTRARTRPAAMPAEFSRQVCDRMERHHRRLLDLRAHPHRRQHYTYRSRNTARGIFRLAFPDAIEPDQHILDRRRRGAPDELPRRRQEAQSPTRRRSASLTGRRSASPACREKKPVDLPLEAGTQDAHVRADRTHARACVGRSPKGFWLIDNDEIKQYKYVREGTETLDTRSASSRRCATAASTRARRG